MLGGINGTTTLSKDARVELREVKRYAGLCARAPGMAVSAIAMCAAGRRRAASRVSENKVTSRRRSGYPKVSVEPFSSDLTSVAASFRASIPVVRYPTTW